MWAHGADPLEMDELNQVLRHLRQQAKTQRIWRIRTARQSRVAPKRSNKRTVPSYDHAVTETSSDAPRATWPAAARSYRASLERYFESIGAGTTPATLSTIETNSTLVPKRGENILRWLRDMGGVESLAQRSVLELGCGFGALATFLVVHENPQTLVAVDVADAYLEVGRRCARGLRLDQTLTFEHVDMRDMSMLGQRFDVVIANNAFIYLTSPRDAQKALEETFAVTKPGGVFILHHANKWRWREPFTKDPLVHLLPPLLARPVCRITGWKHNHGRVRLLSPIEMKRRMKRAGFTEIAIAGASGVHQTGL